MDTERIINSAIYNEQLAMAHYAALADVLKKAGDKVVAQFFADQSKREKGHYNSLTKYKKKAFPSSKVAAGETVKWITREVTDEAGTQVGLSDALTVVEEAEKAAERFYNDAARNTQEKDAKGLFTKLADEEANHRKIMARLRSRLETKGKIETVDFDDLGMD
jgi:rubrerythrin